MSSAHMMANASRAYSRPLTTNRSGWEGTRMLACPRAAVTPAANPTSARTRLACATCSLISSSSVAIFLLSGCPTLGPYSSTMPRSTGRGLDDLAGNGSMIDRRDEHAGAGWLTLWYSHAVLPLNTTEDRHA